MSACQRRGKARAGASTVRSSRSRGNVWAIETVCTAAFPHYRSLLRDRLRLDRTSTASSRQSRAALPSAPRQPSLRSRNGGCRSNGAALCGCGAMLHSSAHEMMRAKHVRRNARALTAYGETGPLAHETGDRGHQSAAAPILSCRPARPLLGEASSLAPIRVHARARSPQGRVRPHAVRLAQRTWHHPLTLVIHQNLRAKEGGGVND